MKEKRSWYKSGYVWGIILLVLGFITMGTANMPGTGPVGILVLIITFIKRALNKGKKKVGGSVSSIPNSGSRVSAQNKSGIQLDLPNEIDGATLAYSYPDVKFNCPIDCLNFAKTLPANLQLSIELDHSNRDDEHSAEIQFRGTRYGYLYNNRIKDMVFDFSRNRERHFLVFTGDPGEEPTIKLFFYKPEETLDDDSDIDDNETTNEE